jgi:hypothetical protein
LSIFACLRIEIFVPVASSGWWGTRHEPPCFRMQEMDMTAGLPNRFKSKISEYLDKLKS